jgi:flagellar protein FliS
MPDMQQANPHQLSRQYLEEQLAGLSPTQLLIRVYDVAIVSCAQQDRQRLSRALVELISALNFEHREVATRLFQLYNYCLRHGKLGHFDTVKPILVELRDAWLEATKAAGPSAASRAVAGKAAG